MPRSNKIAIACGVVQLLVGLTSFGARFVIGFVMLGLGASNLLQEANAQEADEHLHLLTQWLPGIYTNMEQLSSQNDVEDKNAKALRMILVVHPVQVADLEGKSFLFSIDSDDARLSPLSTYIVNFLASNSEALAMPIPMRNPARSRRALKGAISTRIFLLNADVEPGMLGDFTLDVLVEHNPGCRPRTIYESDLFRSRWNTTDCFHHRVPSLLMEKLHQSGMTLWNMMTGPRFELLKSSN